MNTQSFKLYHYPATRSARVKWVLHEVLGSDFEVERVSLYDADQYSSEYLAKNPNHSVPTLEITDDDGNTMYMVESAAMVTYLADAFPEKKLAPSPATFSQARADYLQMLHFGSTWMDMMLWQIRMHEHLLDEDERDPRTVKRYRHKFTEEAEPQIRKRLEANDYICGSQFTAADCIMGHTVMWAKAYGMCQDKAFAKYLSTISKREAFMLAFADAQEFNVEIPAGKPVKGMFTG